MPEAELTASPEPEPTRVEINRAKVEGLRDRQRQARTRIDAIWQEQVDAAIRALEEWEQPDGA